MKDASKLSVVALLPAWNAQSFIGDTLTSLAAQSWPNFNVLISVDKSDDATAAICRDFAESDSRFQVIVQQERLGWIGNVNALLSAVESDYLLIAYHDDILHPSHVETLASVLEENPEAVAAFSDLRAHYLHGVVVERTYTEMDGVKDPAQRAYNLIRRKGFWSAPNHGVFRASAVKEAGGFKLHRGGEFSADWPWLLRLALAGEFVRSPGFLCDKYYKERSLSHSWEGSTKEFAGVMEECARSLLDSCLPTSEKFRLFAVIAAEFAKEEARKGVARFRRWA